jgi:phosphohistidine phosphatase
VQICLVRHAIAVERGSSKYEDDSTRPLTPRGRERMEEAALGLKRIFVPDVIVTSPLLRAKETANILVHAYGLQKSRTCEALASGDNAALLADVDDIDMDRVMLVGHEPHISGTLSWLLTADAGLVSSLFRKGAAALLTADGPPRPGACSLEWLLQPAALRALANQRTD